MTTPAFKIVADGDDVTRAVADRLVSLRITDEAGQTSRASRVPVPRSGAWLKVWLGYSTGGKLPVYMGSFAVDDVHLSGGPRSMTIKATAAQTAPELVKGQKSQSWHGKTLGEVAQEIGKRNGLQVVIKGNLASTQIKHEDQTNESDQAFLTRLAEKHKATIKPADGKLVLVPRGEGQAGATITLKPTDVISWRANLKNRGAYGKVTARYLDRTTQKEKTLSSGADAGGLPAFEDRQLYPCCRQPPPVPPRRRGAGVDHDAGPAGAQRRGTHHPAGLSPGGGWHVEREERDPRPLGQRRLHQLDRMRHSGRRERRVGDWTRRERWPPAQPQGISAGQCRISRARDQHQGRPRRRQQCLRLRREQGT